MKGDRNEVGRSLQKPIKLQSRTLWFNYFSNPLTMFRTFWITSSKYGAFKNEDIIQTSPGKRDNV